jgi:hypothetical protein
MGAGAADVHLLRGHGLVQVSVGADGDPLATNPKVAEPFALSEPFQLTFRTVAEVPLTLRTPFQSWLTLWPPANVQRAVHPLIAVLPARTVTSAWKPPGHELVVR